MLGEMDLNPPSKSKNKTITRAIVLFLDFFDLGGAFVETVENDVQYIQKQGKKERLRRNLHRLKCSYFNGCTVLNAEGQFSVRVYSHAFDHQSPQLFIKGWQRHIRFFKSANQSVKQFFSG